MRMRLCYRKSGNARFVSHRDTERMWRRALRRAGLPLAISRGYSPKEKLEMGFPLPVGVAGAAEDLVFTLEQPLPADEAAARIRAARLPAGFALLSVTPCASGESLFHRTVGLVYQAAGRQFLLPVNRGACEKLWPFLARELGLSEDEARLLDVVRVAVRYRPVPDVPPTA